MQGLLVVVLALIVPVQAIWQAVYNSNFSQVYMQSVNGSLYSVPISAQNITQSNLEANTKQIASAPTNSSLVLDNDGHLFAVWGSQGCGKSPIEISQYDPSHNQWTSVGQSSMKNQNWFQDAQTVWLDRSTDEIYIYGGECQGSTQSGFYVYSLSNNTFAEVSSQNKVMPRQMASAQAIPLNDYETLLVGGRSGDAWVSMQQVAVWQSGAWAFDSVGNSSGIDSRENPLLLPVWELGLNGTSGSVNEVLVIGGTVAGRASNPYMATMKRNETQGWYWTVPDESSNISVSFAACTLYTTLADLDAPSGSGLGKISLYNEETQNKWSTVDQVSVPKQNNTESKSEHGESHGTSTATVAVVSTLLPIIVIALVAIAAWWWLRQRRQRRLFLHPNRRGMLQRQHSAISSLNTNPWSLPVQPPVQTAAIPPIPHPEPDSNSIMMMENNEGNRLFMSQRKRNLRVVNPDSEPIRPGTSRGSSQKNSRGGSRDSSWSSSSNVNPFSDNAEHREPDLDFDFGTS